MQSLKRSSLGETVEERLVLLYSQEQIAERVKALARAMSKEYVGREVVLIGILKGAFVFLADLMRHLHIPVTVDFVWLSSYGPHTHSTGQVVLRSNLQYTIRGKDIVVVEDILDSGLTLRFLLDELQTQQPRSLKICTLLDKHVHRQIPMEVDYVGFRIGEGFVVGYGIDYNEKYRYLPDIYTLEFV